MNARIVYAYSRSQAVADGVQVEVTKTAHEAGIKFPVFNRLKGTRVVAIVKSTVPSGHSSQTSGGYEPGAELIWEHEFTDDFSLAGTWNITRLRQERFAWQRARACRRLTVSETG